MIVEIHKEGDCTVAFDDSAYAGQSPAEVNRIVETLSQHVISCLEKNRAVQREVNQNV